MAESLLKRRVVGLGKIKEGIFKCNIMIVTVAVLAMSGMFFGIVGTDERWIDLYVQIVTILVSAVVTIYIAGIVAKEAAITGAKAGGEIAIEAAREGVYRAEAVQRGKDAKALIINLEYLVGRLKKRIDENFNQKAMKVTVQSRYGLRVDYLLALDKYSSGVNDCPKEKFLQSLQNILDGVVAIHEKETFVLANVYTNMLDDLKIKDIVVDCDNSEGLVQKIINDLKEVAEKAKSS